MNGNWRNENHIHIIETQYLTHNVKRIRTTKPKGYQFRPGEATDMIINQTEWLGKRHAFTFTGLNEWPFLEFTIKIYPLHNGFTAALDKLDIGDELIIHDSFGAFHYRDPGIFIAGGSGITPFVAIFRELAKEEKLTQSQLIYSNQYMDDIILKEELESMLDGRVTYVLTKENKDGYRNGRIDKEFLKNYTKDYSGYFYVCGKKKMMQEIKDDLLALGLSEEKIIIEIDFSQQVLEK